MYLIESGIPAPGRAGTNKSYNFDQFEVGDSILVPFDMAERVRWAVKKYRRAHAPTSCWRTKATNKGVRVWRVS